MRPFAACTLLVCAALAGCATPPGTDAPAGTPTAPEPVAEDAGSGPLDPTFERQWLDRAERAAARGRLAEAAQAYDILATARPRHGDYARALAATRTRIDAAVADRMARASAARQRGEHDAAATLALAALSFDPGHAEAARQLRAYEADRNKRNHLGKLSRHTLTRRAMADAEVQEPPTRAAARAPAGMAPSVQAEVEHAALLASQGELDDAIRLLDRHLGTVPADGPARSMLADLWTQKAQQLRRQNDPRGAQDALARALQAAPRHASALELQKQWRASAPSPSPSPARR
jgi:tetratricopeptide (TPR) repeat protein